MTVHQAFIIFIHESTKQEVAYVAEPDAQTMEYTFDLVGESLKRTLNDENDFLEFEDTRQGIWWTGWPVQRTLDSRRCRGFKSRQLALCRCSIKSARSHGNHFRAKQRRLND